MLLLGELEGAGRPPVERTIAWRHRPDGPRGGAGEVGPEGPAGGTLLSIIALILSAVAAGIAIFALMKPKAQGN